MKYVSGSELYLVCPFIFEIDKVIVDYGFIGEDGFIYYKDNETGAELAEHTLFDNLDDAILQADIWLNKFYEQKKHEIYQARKKFA